MSLRRQIRTSYVLIVFIFVFAVVFTFLRTKTTNNTDAASLTNFNPGNIISDYVMSNYNSMSEAEIQNFLSSKNSCSNRDYSYYQQLSKKTNYVWHWDNGHFICLSEERFGDGEIIGSGDTAAHIIWQAAQDYKINPQVLIVLLQKESGLITDPIPNNSNYRKATGYGCPDTAACSEKYYGFKNQIRNAAKLFRTVLDGGWTNFPLGENYVQYNPSASCGGSVVNIQNLATSALYRYTPYQPNASALAAGYGSGDSCGAYGNRNFYLYFSDWFGSTTAEPLTLEYIFSNMDKVAKEATDIELEYNTHIQNFGWLDFVQGGEMSGTTGYSLRVEALQIKLKGNTGIEYQTYVDGKGWSEYKRDGEISGTVGESRRVEALRIKLIEGLAEKYDVYYRVHLQDKGWTGWSKNGQEAGAAGKALRIEAIQIKIRKKVVEVSTRAHVQDIGWMDWVKNGSTAGTTGQSRRLEAIEIKLSDNVAAEYDITYRAHVQDIGWMDWVKNGSTAGTTGQSRRLEAIEIKLLKK